jgi:hypothetical protein
MLTKSRWHKETKQFLEPDHDLIREQDKISTEAKLAKAREQWAVAHASFKRLNII